MILSLRGYFLLTILSLLSLEGVAQQITSEQALKLVEKNAIHLAVGSGDADNVIVINAYKDKISGMNLIYLQQSYLDVPVYNSLQVIVLKEEEVISVTGSRVVKMAEK